MSSPDAGKVLHIVRSLSKEMGTKRTKAPIFFLVTTVVLSFNFEEPPVGVNGTDFIHQ